MPLSNTRCSAMPTAQNALLIIIPVRSLYVPLLTYTRSNRKVAPLQIYIYIETFTWNAAERLKLKRRWIISVCRDIPICSGAAHMRRSRSDSCARRLSFRQLITCVGQNVECIHLLGVRGDGIMCVCLPTKLSVCVYQQNYPYLVY